MADEQKDTANAGQTDGQTGDKSNGQTDGAASEGNSFNPAEFSKQYQNDMKSLQEKLAKTEQMLGQIPALTSQWHKFQNAIKEKDTKPGAYDQLSEEYQTAYDEIVEKAWAKKFGSKFERFEQLADKLEQSQKASSVENNAKAILGDSYKDHEPFMIEILQEMAKARDDGDQDASDYLDMIAASKAGTKLLVNDAKERYAQKNQNSANDTRTQIEKTAASISSVKGGKSGSSVPISELPRGSQERLDAIIRAGGKKAFEQSLSMG